MPKKQRKATWKFRIVATYFVGHQQACGRSAPRGSLQAIFWLEQHSGGIRGKRAHDDGFELLKLLAPHGGFFYLQFSGKQTTQCITLVDGKGANDAARIGNRFEPLALAWRKLHSKSSVLNSVHG